MALKNPAISAQRFQRLHKASDKNLEDIYREAEALSPRDFQKLLLDSPELRSYIGLENGKDGVATIPNARKPAALARAATHAKDKKMAAQALAHLDSTMSAFKKSEPTDTSWSCRSVEEAVYELVTNLDSIPGRENREKALNFIQEYKHLLPLSETDEADEKHFSHSAKWPKDDEEKRQFFLLSLLKSPGIDAYEPHAQAKDLQENVWKKVQEKRSAWQTRMLQTNSRERSVKSWLANARVENAWLDGAAVELEEWLADMKMKQQSSLAILADSGPYMEGLGEYHRAVLWNVAGGDYFDLEERLRLEAKEEKTPAEMARLKTLEKQPDDPQTQTWNRLKSLERLLQTQQRELDQELDALRERVLQQQRKNDRDKARFGLTLEPSVARSSTESDREPDSGSGMSESGVLPTQFL